MRRPPIAAASGLGLLKLGNSASPQPLPLNSRRAYNTVIATSSSGAVNLAGGHTAGRIFTGSACQER